MAFSDDFYWMFTILQWWHPLHFFFQVSLWPLVGWSGSRDPSRAAASTTRHPFRHHWGLACSPVCMLWPSCEIRDGGQADATQILKNDIMMIIMGYLYVWQLIIVYYLIYDIYYMIPIIWYMILYVYVWQSLIDQQVPTDFGFTEVEIFAARKLFC